MKTTYILLMVGLLGCVSCKARNPQIESASVKLSVVEESDSAVITGDARTEEQQTQVSMCLVLLMLRQVFLSFHFTMEATTVLLWRP